MLVKFIHLVVFSEGSAHWDPLVTQLKQYRGAWHPPGESWPSWCLYSLSSLRPTHLPMHARMPPRMHPRIHPSIQNNCSKTQNLICMILWPNHTLIMLNDYEYNAQKLQVIRNTCYRICLKGDRLTQRKELHIYNVGLGGCYAIWWKYVWTIMSIRGCGNV